MAAITATTDADRRVTDNPEKATNDAPVKASAHRVDQRHEGSPRTATNAPGQAP
jgi:hypothetical protein